MNYNNIIKHYSDEDTIPSHSYLTEEQWADITLCSDTEIEKVICAANSRAQKEEDKMKDGQQQLIWSEGVSRPIPCSERSIQVKIARKIHESQRQNKNLDGLYEVLAPGSTVCKISPTTSVIKEPNRQEVRVQNSDIAKFGTKAERDTYLGQYIERRPNKIYEKAVEQKIIKFRKDLVRKITGDQKKKRNKKQAADIGVVSSGRSCFSTASIVARSLKMRIPERNPKQDDAFTNRPDLTQILHLSHPVPIAPPPHNPNVARPSAARVASPQMPTSILRKMEKRQLTISDTSDSDTSSVRKSKTTLKRKKKPTTSIVDKKFRIRKDIQQQFPNQIPISLGRFRHETLMRDGQRIQIQISQER